MCVITLSCSCVYTVFFIIVRNCPAAEVVKFWARSANKKIIVNKLIYLVMIHYLESYMLS